VLVECYECCSIVCVLSWDNIVSYILRGISAQLFIILIWKVECSNSIFGNVSQFLHETYNNLNIYRYLTRYNS